MAGTPFRLHCQDREKSLTNCSFRYEISTCIFSADYLDPVTFSFNLISLSQAAKCSVERLANWPLSCLRWHFSADDIKCAYIITTVFTFPTSKGKKVLTSQNNPYILRITVAWFPIFLSPLFYNFQHSHRLSQSLMAWCYLSALLLWMLWWILTVSRPTPCRFPVLYLWFSILSGSTMIEKKFYLSNRFGAFIKISSIVAH